MKISTAFCAAALLTIALPSSDLLGQPPRLAQVGMSDLDVGEAGIAWYTTWETAEAEAARSGRPIMFVAAATQCGGVSGVF